MENIVKLLSALAAVAASISVLTPVAAHAASASPLPASCVTVPAQAGEAQRAPGPRVRCVLPSGKATGMVPVGGMSHGAPADWNRVIEDPTARKTLVPTYS
ncbi:hypothetical protein LMG19282_00011 [Cupriavidus campinensis]|nr:hypothetical protein LMG19282_00011 [Cupriavidus campinensis]